MAGLVLYGVMIAFPLLGIVVGDHERTSSFASLPLGFEREGLPLLAWLVLVTIIAAPFARLLLTVLVLGGLRLRRHPWWLAGLARVRAVLAPWSMLEVFLLGMLVAYSRLGAIAPVRLGLAAFALGGLVLAKVVTQSVLDEAAMWEAIRPAPPIQPGRPILACTSCELVSNATEGSACPRCGAALRHRRPASVQRAWAFLIAAAVLYVPANFLPVMTVIRYGSGAPSTILGGVQELLDAGMLPLAALVFVASICVPVLKIVGMAVLLISTQRGTRRRLRDRTRLYRIVDAIGRWSMIDVFMISILTALVQMGAIATVIPDIGAVCFASVVVLTMLSAGSFDPRLMWDSASRTAARARPAATARQAA